MPKHSTAIMQVSVETRDKMLQNQKDAVLRRRKQQLQSGFIKSINTSASISTRLDNDPHVVPTVKTYYTTSNETSIRNNDNIRQEPQRQKITMMRSSNGDARVSPRTNNIKIKNETDDTDFGERNTDHCYDKLGRRGDQPQYDRLHEDVATKRDHRPLSYTTESYIDHNNEEENHTAPRRLKKSPSSLTRMNHDDHAGVESNIFVEDSEYNEKMNTITDSEEEKKKVGMNDESPQGLAKEKNDVINIWDKVDWNNPDEVKRIMMSPCPKEAGMVKCYIRRHKGKAKMFPEYRLYLQDGDTFLMTSKKRAKKQSSNYLISIGKNDYAKNSSNIIGKLRSNFFGTEFQIFDTGINPKNCDPFFDEKNVQKDRSELGAIIYSSNILGNRGPRKMQVCINRIGRDGKSTKQWQPAHRDEEMIQTFKHKTETALRHLYMYENRQPKWNEDMGAYVLNFNKRVNLASVKNFQLIEANSDEQHVTLQFGRASNDEFIMDVQWPMSLFQAFAISLSSFDSKIACD
jgi:tubby-related protein 1